MQRGKLEVAVVLFVVLAGVAWAQAPEVTPIPNQPFYVYDGFGGIHAGDGAPTIHGLPYNSEQWYVDVEIVKVVCSDDGAIEFVGVWALDSLGGVHASDGVPAPVEATPYFGFMAAKDLEIVEPVEYVNCNRTY